MHPAYLLYVASLNSFDLNQEAMSYEALESRFDTCLWPPIYQAFFLKLIFDPYWPDGHLPPKYSIIFLFNFNNCLN